ncbi:MAG: hypothetical protein ACTSWM_03780 [Alphaproteobacteria bacterium]
MVNKYWRDELVQGSEVAPMGNPGTIRHHYLTVKDAQVTAVRGDGPAMGVRRWSALSWGDMEA